MKKFLLPIIILFYLHALIIIMKIAKLIIDYENYENIIIKY